MAAFRFELEADRHRGGCAESDLVLTGNNGVGNGDPRTRSTRPGREPEPVAERGDIGFATRLRFLSLAELEAARAARYGLSLSLALFVLEDRDALRAALEQDLDRCDWELGNRLAGSIRQGPDVLARFALGEWALLLPHTGLDGAIAVAQRCLERVCGQELRLPGAGPPVQVSVSAGVATHQPVRRYGVETVAGLLQAAQRAQRQSSALGGGRAVGWSADSGTGAGPPAPG